MLKLGIAFLAWLLLLAVLIEAGNSKPCPFCGCLASLGVKTSSKGIVFSEYRSMDVEIIGGDAARIHPQVQALVTNELHNADGFLDSGILRLRPLGLVLVNQHYTLLCLSL